MKKILLIAAAVALLGACSTGQVANSKFACGGTSHLTAEFAAATVEGGQPQLTSVNVCTGTNGSDRKFEYVISDPSGHEVKRISYGSTSTEATSALMVVGEVLKATSSNDAAVASAAIKALPEVLNAFVRLSSPLP
mgnify:CR=1 FL=1